MNTEQPYDIRKWDELTDAEKQRYMPIPYDEEAEVMAMDEAQRKNWLLKKRLAKLELPR